MLTTAQWNMSPFSVVTTNQQLELYSADIKEDHTDTADVSDVLFPVAISKITQCSTFVVVCRLRSHEHTITSQESELVWPEFPLARISFPQNAIPRDESVEVIVKVSLSHVSIIHVSIEICYCRGIESKS